MLYIDSSILLEAYLSQPRKNEALKIMGRAEPKVSSWLLAIEVPIVLRRLLSSNARNKALLAAALAQFDKDKRGISLMEGLAALSARVQHDPRFSSCRALDAIHTAAALQFQETANHPVYVATFDQRLQALAGSLGLRTVPTAP